MQSNTKVVPISNNKLWAGRIISALALLFLLFDSVIKLMKIAPVVESFNQLGYPVSLALGVGILELLCIVVYVIPRTSVLGAILLTGYLGGAVASHVRIESPLFSHVLFPIYVGVLVWGGLYLRDDRLPPLIPLRKKDQSVI
jgi:DoxX-like family